MKTNEKKLLFTTIVAILALLAGFTVYNFVSFYNNAVRSIQSVVFRRSFISIFP